MTVWQYDIGTVRRYDSRTVWQYDSMTLWRCDSMKAWQYDGIYNSMTVWWYDGMTVWHYDRYRTVTAFFRKERQLWERKLVSELSFTNALYYECALNIIELPSGHVHIKLNFQNGIKVSIPLIESAVVEETETLWTCVLQNGEDLCVNQGGTLRECRVIASYLKKERRRNKERKKEGKNSTFTAVWFRMQTIVFETIYMYTGRKSHVDSDGEG